MSPDQQKVCAELIEPSLLRAGWTWDRDVRPDAVGDRAVHGARGISLTPARADYLLRFHQMPLGILEVFSEKRPLSDALMEAEDLARRLHLRFAIATNGRQFIIRDLETGAEETMDESPVPEALLKRRSLNIDWTKWAPTFETPWFKDNSEKGVFIPRLFQEVAIFEMLASFASSNSRALIAMPTGSGKTTVIIQFIWKLLRGGVLGGRRILILADLIATIEHTISLMARIPEFQSIRLDRDIISSGRLPSAHVLVASPRRLGSPQQGAKPYESLHPDDIGLVICLELYSRLGTKWMEILTRFPDAHQLALVSTTSEEASLASEVYRYFTAPTAGKPVFSMSVQTRGILAPMLDARANSKFTIFDFMTAFAGCVLLKLAQDANPHLFPPDSRWKNLLMLPAPEMRNYLSKHIFTQLRTLRNSRLRSYHLLETLFTPETIDPDLLAITVTQLAKHDLAKPDVRQIVGRELDSLFDAWLRSGFESGGAHTPVDLANWIAEILSPKRGESIYDPHCGAGSLLSALLSYATSAKSSTPPRETIVHLCGAEPNTRLCLLALARLSLAKGADLDLKLLGLSAILASEPTGPTYDCVVANPPFGMRVEDGAERQLPVRVRTSQAAILVHCLMRLRSGGRAAILVPDSILFNLSDRSLREFLLTKYCVNAVVALPERIFGGRTSIKRSLLILRNDKPSESVLFVSRDLTAQFFNGQNPLQALVRRLLTSTLQWQPGDDASVSRIHEAWRDMHSRLEEVRAAATRSGKGKELHQVNEAAIDLVLTVPNIHISIENLNAEAAPPHLPENVAPTLARSRLTKLAWRSSVSELAERNFQLLPQDPGTQALHNLLGLLGQHSEPVIIRKLEEIASVYSGMRPDRDAIFHYRDAAPEGSYNDVLTVRDLEPIISGSSCSRWVGPEVFSTLPAKYNLRENDILLASLGQIGATAIYKDDFVRHPYDDLIVVRLHDQSVMPEYIWRLLQTEPYQLWLKGHAAGSTIQRLSARVLAEISIPIPPMEFQRQVAEGFKGRESLETLLPALTQLRPVSHAFRFLTDEECALQLASLPDKDLTPSNCLPLLNDLITKWNDSSKLASEEMTRYFALLPFLKWSDERLSHLTDLVSILAMPDGADRYIALQTWERKRFGEQNAPVTPHEALEEDLEKDGTNDPLLVQALKARLDGALKIFRRLSDLVFSECRRMMETATTVSATISPSVIPPNRESTMTVTVTNETFFGLRFFNASISDRETGGSFLPHFAPGQVHSWTFKLTPDRAGRIPIEIKWFALRLDEEVLGDAAALAVETQEGTGTTSVSVLDKTPYIVGPSITGDKQGMFFGRQQIVDEIRRSLRNDGPSTVLVVEGNRRLGKSSLLIHLQQEHVLPGWIPVYLSFQRADGAQGKDGFATSTVFYNIAKAVLAAARAGGARILLPQCGQVPTFNSSQPNAAEVVEFTAFARQKIKPLFDGESPFESLQLVVESVIAAIGSRRVLLMLDEFDKLQVGVDNGVTSPLVPENLRSLFHTYPQVSGILAGSRRMREMRNEYFNALFGLGKSLRISALDPQSASQLITEPVKGSLVYAEPAVEFIIRETACQPFLIQGISDRVFSHYASSTSQDRVVTLSSATTAANLFSEDNEHFSQVWFNDIITDFRHFILCLVDSSSQGPDPVTADFILLQMERSGIGQVNLKELGDDLDELVGLEILAQEGGPMQTTYRINIPLLARWMRQNIDYRRYRLAARMERE